MVCAILRFVPCDCSRNLRFGHISRGTTGRCGWALLKAGAASSATTGYCYGNAFGEESGSKLPHSTESARLRLECGGLPPLSRTHQRQGRKRLRATIMLCPCGTLLSSKLNLVIKSAIATHSGNRVVNVSYCLL